MKRARCSHGKVAEGAEGAAADVIEATAAVAADANAGSLFGTGVLSRRCAGDRTGVRQVGDVPTQIEQLPLTFWRENTVGESGELGLEILIAHRVVQAADRVFDELLEAAAVFRS